MQGAKEVLGLWAGQAEGPKFWLQVLTEIKNWGVTDVFIACVDGLKGFPESIATVFPEAQVQLCMVHQVRDSLNYASWKTAQKRWLRICSRFTVPAQSKRPSSASMSLPRNGMGAYPTISQMWRRNWSSR